MLKKAASGVLAIVPCSRTESTLRAPKWLRPCWSNLLEHSLPLMMSVSLRGCIGHRREIFNGSLLPRLDSTQLRLKRPDCSKPSLILNQILTNLLGSLLHTSGLLVGIGSRNHISGLSPSEGLPKSAKFSDPSGQTIANP